MDAECCTALTTLESRLDQERCSELSLQRTSRYDPADDRLPGRRYGVGEGGIIERLKGCDLGLERCCCCVALPRVQVPRTAGEVGIGFNGGGVADTDRPAARRG